MVSTDHAHTIRQGSWHDTGKALDNLNDAINSRGFHLRRVHTELACDAWDATEMPRDVFRMADLRRSTCGKIAHQLPVGLSLLRRCVLLAGIADAADRRRPTMAHDRAAPISGLAGCLLTCWLGCPVGP